jgi:hypothetical protein
MYIYTLKLPIGISSIDFLYIGFHKMAAIVAFILSEPSMNTICMYAKNWSKSIVYINQIIGLVKRREAFSTLACVFKCMRFRKTTITRGSIRARTTVFVTYSSIY